MLERRFGHRIPSDGLKAPRATPPPTRERRPGADVWGSHGLAVAVRVEHLELGAPGSHCLEAQGDESRPLLRRGRPGGGSPKRIGVLRHVRYRGRPQQSRHCRALRRGPGRWCWSFAAAARARGQSVPSDCRRTESRDSQGREPRGRKPPQPRQAAGMEQRHQGRSVRNQTGIPLRDHDHHASARPAESSGSSGLPWARRTGALY